MKSIHVTAFVESSQRYDLDGEIIPDHDQIAKDFNEIEVTLDPAIHCEWKVEDIKVVSFEITDDQVTRDYSCMVSIMVNEEEFDSFREFMEEEGYYDEDEEAFDWENAINCFLTDVCDVDYASFDGASVNIDVTEFASN